MEEPEKLSTSRSVWRRSASETYSPKNSAGFFEVDDASRRSVVSRNSPDGRPTHSPRRSRDRDTGTGTEPTHEKLSGRLTSELL